MHIELGFAARILLGTQQWFTLLVLSVLTLGVTIILRQTRERVGYVVALSILPGQLFLLVIVLISASILQGDDPVQNFFLSTFYEALVLAAAIVISIVATAIRVMTKVPEPISQRYIRIFVRPILFFAIFGVSLPVVFVLGGEWHKIFVIVLMLLFAICLIIDIGTDRYNERDFLRDYRHLEW